MEEAIKYRKLFFGVLFAVILSFSVLTFSKRSDACCEQAATATSAVFALAADVLNRIQNWIDQATSFIDLSFLNAQWEVVTRFIEFDENTRENFADFWGNYRPALQNQTAQINTAEVDQAQMLGAFIDAEQQLGDQRNFSERNAEGTRRFLPSDQSCQIESVKDTISEAEHMSKALATAVNEEGKMRQGNYVGTPSANGPDSERRALITEMRAEFCVAGMPGCAGNGALPLQNILITDRMRGVEMSKDLANPSERTANTRVVDNFVSPRSMPVISTTVLATPQAQSQFVYNQRPAMARKALLRYVTAEQLGESVEAAPNVNVAATRTASGVPAATVSANPSLHEIEEAQRERLLSQVFFEDRVEDPHTLLRTMADLKEQQLRSWVKIKKIRERRLALLSAELGFDNENQQTTAPSGR